MRPASAAGFFRRIAPFLVASMVLIVGTALFWSNRQDAGPHAVADPMVPVADLATTPTAPPITAAPAVAPVPTQPPPEALPAGSGEGRRIVFSVSAQRMWWVEADGAAVRTARVSGRAGTPAPGTYSVYSRSELATGLDGSKMQKFVRFTEGSSGWAIGFHSIPTMNGAPVQTDAELGQPLSHGCIRQAQADADFTWLFAPVGSAVVVLA